MPPAKPNLAAVPKFEPTNLATQDVFPRDECLDWMRHWCDPKHGRYQVLAFSLSHIDARAVGDAFTNLTHFMVPADEKTGALPNGLPAMLEKAADEFCRAATAHCAAVFTNRQGYVIQGHHRGKMVELPDGTKEEEDLLTVNPRTTFPFSVTPPLGARENFEGNEKPTAEGALASFQRQLDTVSRNQEATIAKVLKGYETWNEKLIDKLTDTFEIITVQNRQLQDAEDRRQTRAIEAKKADFELEVQSSIKDAIETKVMPIVELLVKARLGILPAQPALGEPAPEPNPAALAATIRALNLTPTQLGRFVADLRPEQNQMLRPLLTELSQGMAPADQQELLRVVAEEIEKKKAQLEAGKADAK